MLDLTHLPQLARNAGRLGEIVAVLARYGLAGWLARIDRRFLHRIARHTPLGNWSCEPREARIRLAFTELGTTFIKLGQVLSTRRDLIGKELAEELSKLQANVPADPFEDTQQTILSELHRPIAELFASFDPTPLACASIAQVYRATLHDGRHAAVKVRRRGIENRIQADLAIMGELALLLEQYLPEMRSYRPVAVVEEFRRTITREMDFRRELRNLQLFRAAFQDDPSIHFPEPYAAFSTSRVLTMEFLEGVPFTQPQEIQAQGGDLSELTSRGARIFLDMIFHHGFYHADPHPGNILYLGGSSPLGAIGLIDFGMVGRIDQDLRSQIERAVCAVVRRDTAELTEIIMEVGEVPPQLDPKSLHAEVAEQLQFYWGMPLEQFQIGTALNELTDSIRRYQILLPASLSMLIRVLVILEGMGRTMHPQFNLVPLLEPYAREFTLRRYSPVRLWQTFSTTARDWNELLGMVPRQMRTMLKSMNRREWTIGLSHLHLEPSVNRLVFGLLTSAIFLGSAIMWAFKAPPLVFGEVSLFGVIGFAISTVLSWRLFRAINHSGRLEE